MKVKYILVKVATVAALSASGVAIANDAKTSTVHAATIENDAAVVTVNYVDDGNGIRIWNSYKHPKATGQVLPSNSSWKVIKTAYDKKGHKWYDLGKNQWVRAKYVNRGYHALNETTTAESAGAVATDNSAAVTSTNTDYQTYAAPATDSESGAKAWIASHESGGSY
ncbi:hypothetical protein EQ500_03270, partial [Lactobacillus sp. XV13L]|nr:hypothetical protein [Lactobacillus sp. XV13L]